jgi:hypothetical protein
MNFVKQRTECNYFFCKISLEILSKSKGKGKVQPIASHEDPEGHSSTLSLTSALDRGGWSTPRPGRFTPGKEPAGWPSEPVWTGTENLDSTGIRSPDRSARSESLYRLSYPGSGLIRPMRN